MSARTVEEVEAEDEQLGHGTAMDSGDDIAAMETIRRGIEVSPELKEGLRGTLLLYQGEELGLTEAVGGDG